MKMITYLWVSSLLLFSGIKVSGNSDSLDSKWAKDSLRSIYIQLIPLKGIVLGSDSILLGKTSVKNILSKINTSSISYKLVIDKPMQMAMSNIGSPPPCIDDCPKNDYQHKPDEYFTNYSASLQIDSLNFEFSFMQPGKNVMDAKDFIDSLNLISIKVRKTLNAGLFDDLKIGDPYQQIFKHYEKPKFSYRRDMIRTEIKENGVIFTIENNEIHSDTFNKIIEIEINSRL